MIPELFFYKLNSHAVLPTFATQHSACFDLHACLTGGKIKAYSALNHQVELDCCSFDDSGIANVVIPSYFRALIPTGLIMDIPENYSVRIHPRSGLSFKTGLVMANSEGVIDSDYIQECFIMIKNDSLERITIKHGDRIAQGEMIPKLIYTMKETYDIPTQKTNRIGGFGSTGV